MYLTYEFTICALHGLVASVEKWLKIRPFYSEGPRWWSAIDQITTALLYKKKKVPQKENKSAFQIKQVRTW